MQRLLTLVRRSWAVGYRDSSTGCCIFRSFFFKRNAERLVTMHGAELGLALRRQ